MGCQIAPGHGDRCPVDIEDPDPGGVAGFECGAEATVKGRREVRRRSGPYTGMGVAVAGWGAGQPADDLDVELLARDPADRDRGRGGRNSTELELHKHRQRLSVTAPTFVRALSRLAPQSPPPAAN